MLLPPALEGAGPGGSSGGRKWAGAGAGATLTDVVRSRASHLRRDNDENSAVGTWRFAGAGDIGVHGEWRAAATEQAAERRCGRVGGAGADEPGGGRGD